MDEVSAPTPTAEDKLKTMGQLYEVAAWLSKLFGQKDAAKMLRAAAKMIAPPQPKAVK